jgi:hypothetical protein
MNPIQTSSFNNQIPPRQVIRNITSNYTVTGADYGVVLNVVSTASVTLAFAPSASLGAGFQVTVWNTSSTLSSTVTLQPNNSEKIDVASNVIMYVGEGTQVISDGTGLRLGSKKTMHFYAENSNFGTAYTRPVASSINSVAIGCSAQATNNSATAIGYFAIASGASSVAIAASRAGGLCSVAIQTQPCCSYGTTGNYSAATLRYAKTGASYGQAYGYGTNAAGTSAVALGKCATATGTSTLSFGTSTTATPNYSSAIGNNGGGTGSVTATNVGAMALGGSYASGVCSFAAAIGNNTSTYGATGGYYPIAIGYHAKAQCTYAIAIGAASVAFANSAIAIGLNATSGSAGVAIGKCAYTHLNCGIAIGLSANSGTVRSVAIGAGANSQVRGKYAYSAYASVSNGDSQTGTTILVATTTNATATVMTTNNTGAGTDTLVNLPNNTAYAFTGIVVARQQAAGGTASAAWSVSGLIRREGTASTTTLVASTVTAISNVPSWTLALSADTTNGALAVTFTGAASTNIYCVATIQTSECTYA